MRLVTRSGMSRNFVKELLIFLLIIIGSSAREKSSNIQTLSDGSVFHMNLTDVHTTSYLKQVSIAASSNVTFSITTVSSDTSFIIFQIHVYQYNVTMSYDKDYLSKVSNRSVFGSNIGLLSRQAAIGTTHLFVENNNTHDVKALVVAILYPNQAPVPGGCNMEFNTEIAPYMHVQNRDTMVIVDMQPPSKPFNDIVQPSCEKNPVDVKMYQMFLSEQDFSDQGYFEAITKMLTVLDIKMNGYEVTSPLLSTSMRRIFNAYIGIGSVYVAVATYGNHSAAYVPSFSYGCDPVTDPISCHVLPTTFLKIVNGLCLVLGSLLMYVGPKFYKIDTVVPIFFTGCVLGYAIAGNIQITLLTGLLVLVPWGICNYCCPLIGQVTYSLTIGLQLCSVIFFYLPDSLIIMQQDWIFWLLFSILTITISLAYTILCLGNFLVVTSIFISFMMVLPIDYFVGSSLKYIIINIVRRATVKDFGLAAVQHPTQAWDICLIILWMFLAIFHFCRHMIMHYRGGSAMESRRLLG